MAARPLPALVLSALFSLLVGCRTGPGPAGPGGPGDPSLPDPAADGSTADDAAAQRPRLVVLVVIDQLGSWVLDRYLPLLPEDGALRTMASAGAFHHRVALPYAATYTAVGHVAITSGATPNQSGVATNTIYSAARAARIAITDDGEHAKLGVTTPSAASPTIVRVDGIGDTLEAATGGRAGVVSVSFKDRSAILAAGKRPDLALWYEIEIPGMTTSSYYADALPEWLVAWQAAHPLADLLATPWTAADPDRYRELFGDDDAPGEGDYYGLGRAFPHDARASSDPYRVLRLFPHANEYTLALALEAARASRLGADDVPDLLIVSLSALDYAGHVYGPESWEFYDNFVRTDRALARFLADLAGLAAGALSVVVTADHGVAPLPERNLVDGKPAPRIFPDQLIAALNEAAGAGAVIQFAKPFVYLSEKVRADPGKRAAAVAAVIARLDAMPEVAGGYDVTVARGWLDDPDPVKRAVALSIPPETDADVYLLPAEHAVIDEDMSRGAGTGHGTPWAYDTEIPALVWGAGVTAEETREPLDHRRIAATLAALLGVPAPTHAQVEPLPGVISFAPPAP